MDSNTSSSMQYNLTGMSVITSATLVSESPREGPEKSILNRLPKSLGQPCKGIYSHLPRCPKRLYRKHKVRKMPSFKLVCQKYTPRTWSLMTSSEGANWMFYSTPHCTPPECLITPPPFLPLCQQRSSHASLIK